MNGINSHLPYQKELSSEIHYVIADPHLSPTHPDLLLAQNLGLSPISPNAFLYEYFKNKTRVVLSGDKGKKECLARVLHTMDFYNQPLSYCLETPINSKQVHFADTEFVLFEGGDNNAALHPTIALISDIDNEKVEEYHNFIESITKGGILIYNEEDEALKTLVETTRGRYVKWNTVPLYLKRTMAKTFSYYSRRRIALRRYIGYPNKLH